MALELTENAQAATEKINLEPQIVLVIEGVDTVYGSATIEEIIRIGDPGLLIGDDWVIGGYADVDDQADYITLEGTSNEITQQLAPERGAVSSISSMQIALVDVEDAVTQLISPGIVVDDVLGRRATVWLGFKGTSFKEDFVPIFKGMIDDIVSEQGKVVLNIAHPDQKKRQDIFKQAHTQLNGGINNSVTTITVDATADFLAPVNGPSGANDTSLTFYVRIDDEIIRYTGKSGTQFTSCTRGALNTTAAAHSDDAEVVSFYRLEGTGVELALKLMLSGWNGYFATSVATTHFNKTSTGETVDNSIFFTGVDLELDYGLTAGDYITTTGASNGANNVSLKVIDSIVITDDGSYMIVDGVTFVEEVDTAATISFRSQYDVFGEGLAMYPDEVDIAEHLRWFRLFLSSFEFDFYLKDTIEGKEFIEKQIFLPMGAYTLPRKARSSMGFHSSPIPNSKIVILNEHNVLNPSKIKKRRAVGKNFYNTIVFAMEESALEEKFLFGHIKTDATSKTRIPVGNKTLTIEANGMRRNLNAENLGETAATRLLNRYKYGAEFFDGIEVLFSVGYSMEVGDICVLDGTEMNISDTTTGTRGAVPRLYEVINKRLNIKNGNISLMLVDTNFSTANRYGLISPASKVRVGTSQSVFTIKESYHSVYGTNEYRKWDRYIGAYVRVRNSSGSVAGSAFIQSITGNQVTLDANLGFTPAENYIMELGDYDNQPDEIKLLYTFMSDTAFADGKPQYVMA